MPGASCRLCDGAHEHGAHLIEPRARRGLILEEAKMNGVSAEKIDGAEGQIGENTHRAGRADDRGCAGQVAPALFPKGAPRLGRRVAEVRLIREKKDVREVATVLGARAREGAHVIRFKRAVEPGDEDIWLLKAKRMRTDGLFNDHALSSSLPSVRWGHAPVTSSLNK